MKKIQELFETELAEIREELLRLGVRPKENPTKPATSVSERQIITPSTLTAAQAAATEKELHDAWQETSCHWLYRMQSEIALWANLGSKLTTTRSVPEAYEACTKCVSQQMKMTAEDAQRLLNDCQRITQKIAQSLRKGAWFRNI